MNWHDNGYYEFREFCVDIDRKRQGIGTKLLKAVESGLISEGIKDVLLYTHKDGEAKQFYQRNGYFWVSSHTNE